MAWAWLRLVVGMGLRPDVAARCRRGLYGLIVEVLLERGELAAAHHIALPPRFEETEAVAHELDNGGLESNLVRVQR